jgi:HPt (histidine-containing phosphotransfer) domain-containing protein
MTHDPIDTAVLRALQESTDTAFVAELLASFLEDAPLALAALRAAASAHDAQAFRRQAHTLKANAVTFGAGPMGEAARRLEETPLADHDAQGATPARIEQLASAYAAAALRLKELCHA